MFVPLSDFLISPRPGAEAVAILPDGTVKHFADLHAETADLAARIKAAGARRLVLACESGYGFVCGMLAAFQVGCHLIVPPNALPRVLAQFVAPDCSLLSDIPGAGGAAHRADRRRRHGRRSDPGDRRRGQPRHQLDP